MFFRKSIRLNGTYLFVHIPKTAGTSVRFALRESLGRSKVVQDYGDVSEETDRVVLDYVYRHRDVYSLFQTEELKSANFLLGHFPVRKYCGACQVKNIFTFVREPFERVVSSYLHKVRNKNLNCSFEEYFRRPGSQNVQARLMSGVPIEAIGFVGVTSRYAESLELLSKIVGFQVPLLKKNVAPESKNSSNIDPFEKFRPEVLSLNDSDCELYKLSNEILDKRLRYEKFGQIFAHAKSWRDRNGVPVGWAYYDENSPPPVVQLLNSEGESIDEMPATLHRPDLAALKVPRSGFVGFRFESPEAIKSGVMIQLEENGQKVDLSV